MGFGAGFILDMNNRLKNNRTSIRSDRNKQKEKFMGNNARDNKSSKPDRTKMSAEAKNRIQLMAEEDRRKRLKMKIISAGVALFIFALIYFFA